MSAEADAATEALIARLIQEDVDSQQYSWDPSPYDTHGQYNLSQAANDADPWGMGNGQNAFTLDAENAQSAWSTTTVSDIGADGDDVDADNDDDGDIDEHVSEVSQGSGGGKFHRGDEVGEDEKAAEDEAGGDGKAAEEVEAAGNNLEGTSSAGATDYLNSGSHNQDSSSELMALPAQREDTTVAELREALIDRQFSTMSPAHLNDTPAQPENTTAKDAKELLHKGQCLRESLCGPNDDAAVTSTSSVASSSKLQQKSPEKHHEVDTMPSSSKGKGHRRTKAIDPSLASSLPASFTSQQNPFNDPPNLDPVPSTSKGKGKAKEITETPQDPVMDPDEAYPIPAPTKRKGHTRTNANGVNLISSQEPRSQSSTNPFRQPRQPRYLDPTIASSSKNKGRAESPQNPYMDPHEAGLTPKHKGHTRTKAVDWNLVRGEPHLSTGRGRRPNVSSLAPLPRRRPASPFINISDVDFANPDGTTVGTESTIDSDTEARMAYDFLEGHRDGDGDDVFWEGSPGEGQVIYIPLPGQREEKMIMEGRMARPEPEVVEIRIGEHETTESIMADIRNGELKV
ncbi:MAG: hypothetical protein Q9187_002090 [Circinaria calcarea]